MENGHSVFAAIAGKRASEMVALAKSDFTRPAFTLAKSARSRSGSLTEPESLSRPTMEASLKTPTKFCTKLSARRTSSKASLTSLTAWSKWICSSIPRRATQAAVLPSNLPSSRSDRARLKDLRIPFARASRSPAVRGESGKAERALKPAPKVPRPVLRSWTCAPRRLPASISPSTTPVAPCNRSRKRFSGNLPTSGTAPARTRIIFSSSWKPARGADISSKPWPSLASLKHSAKASRTPSVPHRGIASPEVDVRLFSLSTSTRRPPSWLGIATEGGAPEIPSAGAPPSVSGLPPLPQTRLTLSPPPLPPTPRP